MGSSVKSQLGSSFKPREERKALILAARMQADQGWRDVTVRNVSSRGMMLSCNMPPPRNSYVEIRYRTSCIVGRVIWSNAGSFGIRSQDTIDLSTMLSKSTGPAVRATDRGRTRGSSRESVQMRALPAADASRILARLFDWSAISLAVGLGALAIADLAGLALRQPIEAAEMALSGAKASPEDRGRGR